MKRLLFSLAALAILCGTARAQDVCAPAKVTSISQTATWYAAFTITWTATGDDCNTGNATTYEVYYSTSPITDTNWQSAQLVCSDNSATNGNTNECCITVSPCSTATRYFAIFLIDEAGNRSPIATGSGSARCSAPFETCL
jgi:hypothetical protein